MESIENTMEIFIKSGDIKFILQVKESITLDQLKSKVYDKMYIDQIEYFKFWNQRLLGTKTLKDYEIKRQYTLEMQFYTYSDFGIVLKTLTTKEQVQTGPDQAIKGLKRIISVALDIPVQDQELMYNGKLLEDEKTLQDYGIEEGSEVNVMKCQIWDYQLAIKLEGAIFHLEIRRSDKLADIKQQIEKLFGFPAKDQKLSFKGQDLLPHLALLEQVAQEELDLGLAQEELDLEILNDLIYVSISGHPLVKIHVKKEAKVSELKQLVEKNTGILSTMMTLKSYKGKLLMNEALIASYCDGKILKLDIQVDSVSTLKVYFGDNRTPGLLYFDKVDFIDEDIILQLKRKYDIYSDRFKLLKPRSKYIQENFERGYIWVKEYKKIHLFVEGGTNVEFYLTLEQYTVEELRELLLKNLINLDGKELSCIGCTLQDNTNLIYLMQENTLILYLTSKNEKNAADPHYDPEYLYSSKTLPNQFLAVVYSTSKFTNNYQTINAELQKCCNDKIPLVEDPECPLQYSIDEYFRDQRNYHLHKLLSQGNYLQLRSFLCSILSDLSFHQDIAYKDTQTYHFRGVEKNDLKLNDYNVGNKLYWTSFSSIFSDIEIAKDQAGNEGFIFWIKIAANKPYHNIKLPPEQSKNPLGEGHEVLLFPNFYFQVIENEKVGSLTHIYIEEVPYKNLLNLKKQRKVKVVWYDVNIHTRENQAYQLLLSKLSDNIEIIDNEAECRATLDLNIECILIVSGSNGIKLVPQINSILSLRSVIVFTSSKSLEYHKGWASKYPKVKKVAISFEEVINEIKKENLNIPMLMHYCDNDLAINMIN